ncbi:hypothetical protein AAG906_002678 [Vitis piasezkii]|uniref:SHSP domain-containing protein n=1 Tax=Vitis vinifera TaxID=29760 RepID=A0ABY9BPQ5_VITVI|nr:17.1 kDa class II heat shock protein [Vitis vinifera]WJZ84897.1 hypothetical protein VitviT2T_004473 [Vitis vinifera]|eukprot:XP_002279547.1 PREDICTED: 17.1 kDa class II heat shock protein-like [Vitis vinifera]
MDLRTTEIESKMVAVRFDTAEMSEEPEKQRQPSRTHVRDGKSMNKTLADVKEYPHAYVFIVDMPGLTSDQIQIGIEGEKAMVVSGERKLDKEDRELVRVLRMERKRGKLMKKFELAKNANIDAITAAYQDGVLSVTVGKKPLLKPKKIRNIPVRVG